MTRVLIGSRYAPDVEALLNDAPSEAEVTFLPEGEKLADHLSGVEILFGILSESDFDRADALKWVQQPHAGAEGHLYEKFKNSRIMLTNAGGLFGPQIAEHAFALLLSLTRQIRTQLEFMKSKQWRGAPCLELAGMTMGIIGLGGIGRAVADRAKAFEFRVIAVDPEDMPPPESVDRLEKIDYLPELMSQSDVVMVCCPITADTHKLLSQDLFDRLNAGSFLINVSRGKGGGRGGDDCGAEVRQTGGRRSGCHVHGTLSAGQPVVDVTQCDTDIPHRGRIAAFPEAYNGAVCRKPAPLCEGRAVAECG